MTQSLVPSDAFLKRTNDVFLVLVGNGRNAVVLFEEQERSEADVSRRNVVALLYDCLKTRTEAVRFALWPRTSRLHLHSGF